MIKLPRWQWMVFILCTTSMIIGGVWFMRVWYAHLRDNAYQDLQAIADLKAADIAQWRQERLGDGAVLAENPYIIDAARQYLRERDSVSMAILRAGLAPRVRHYKYQSAALVDAAGNVILHTGAPGGHQFGINSPIFDEAIRGDTVSLTDIYTGDGDSVAHLSVVIPMPAQTPGARPDGAILLISDASAYLYPLIQSWPTASRSSETLLIRRDGDSVLFLNELRHRKGTALKLRIALTDTMVPAVMAVLGREGIMSGRDYRGVSVLSVIKKVPGSPWYMVAKVDSREAFAVMRREMTVLGLLLLFLVLLIATTLGALWQRQSKAHYRTLAQTEKQRRLGEERYRTTLLSIGDGFIATDDKGCVEILNPVAERLTGWSGADAIGKPLEEIFRIVNEDTRATVENPVNKVLREGAVVGLANHTLLIAADGTERPIADSGAPIRNADGTIAGVVLVFSDQSEKHAAEKRLLYHQELLNLTGRMAHVGGWEFDCVTGKGTWTDEVARIHDMVPGVETNMELGVSFYTPQSRARIEDAIKRACESGEPYDLELEMVTAKGNHKWVRTIGVPVMHSGKPVKLHGSFQDITSSMLAQETLRRSEERFRSFFENAPGYCYMVSPQGTILAVNHTVQEALGYTHEDLVGKPIVELYTPGYRERAKEILTEWQRTGTIGNAELQISAKDGSTRTVILSAAAVRHPEGGLLHSVTIQTDITERKAAENRIVHLNAVLKAIRDINQLIVRVHNPAELLRSACNCLVETRGYQLAWAVTCDAPWSSAASSARPEPALEPMHVKLATGWVPPCAQRALRVEQSVLLINADNECESCPLKDSLSSCRRLVARMQVGGHAYGVLCVVLPPWYTQDDEELSLMAEVAGDLGFAIRARAIELKRDDAQQALLRAGERFASILESVSDGFLALAQDFTVTHFNSAAGRLLGRDPHDVLGKGLFEVFPEARGSTFEEQYELAIRERKALSFETFFDRPPYVNWYDVRVYPYENGIAVFFVITTEAKAREEETRRYARETETIADLATALLAAQSPEDIYRTVGERIRLIIGAGQRFIVSGLNSSGRAVRIFQHYGFDGVVEKILGLLEFDPRLAEVPLTEVPAEDFKLFTCGKIVTLKNGLRQLGGGKVAPMVATALEKLLGIGTIQTMGFAFEGKLFGGVTFFNAKGASVTSERLIEAMINQSSIALQRHISLAEQAKLTDMLRQSQKLEAIGVLAGGIAHDFNNILAGIMGYTHLAGQHVDEPVRVRRNLDGIDAASRRAATLVRQILAFSRRTETQSAPYNPGTVAKEALKLLRSSLPATINLEYTVATDGWTVVGDPTQFHQVIMNLCTNASQALADSKGSITVTVRSCAISEPQIVNTGKLAPGTYLQLLVNDSGSGISAQVFEHLFEPFFTTKPRDKGTGMGLSVVHGIVVDHGGGIDVVSEEGRGSTFTVYLPATNSKHDEDAGKPASEVIARGTERVLIVDDELSIADTAREMLKDLGYRVDACYSSIEALSAIEARPELYDALVTDLTMPSKTGVELAKQCLEVSPKLRVVLCTGYSEKQMAQDALGKGIRVILHKPYTQAEIARAVRKAFE